MCKRTSPTLVKFDTHENIFLYSIILLHTLPPSPCFRVQLPELKSPIVLSFPCDVLLPNVIVTVGLLNSELTMKGHSSVVDTMSSDQKLIFFITELLTKGQPPVVDTLKSSRGCPYQPP